MSRINKKTESRPVSTLSSIDDLDMLDEDRDSALERGVIDHGSIDFFGRPLCPLSIETYALLLKTKNRLMFGDGANALVDCAAFVILHLDDEELYKTAKKATSGDWEAFVLEWMANEDKCHAKLLEFWQTVLQIFTDYDKAITSDIESLKGHGSGNAGGHTG